MPSYLVETFLARGDAGGRTARERRARSVAAARRGDLVPERAQASWRQ